MRFEVSEIQEVREFLESMEDEATANGGALDLPDDAELVLALMKLCDHEVRAVLDDPDRPRWGEVDGEHQR